jgi:hypothetical protein
MLSGFNSEEAQCAAGDEVTLEVEGVVDGVAARHVQDLALAIDRSPQPQTLASDHDRHLVEVPPAAGRGSWSS